MVAEPEYLVQSLKSLAKIGAGNDLDKLSKISYDYYPKSIQATLMRADILLALNRENESCVLRTTLIRNVPWDQDQINKYILCVLNGYEDKNLRENLLEITAFNPKIDDSEIPSSNHEAEDLFNRLSVVATRARIEFTLHHVQNANQLRRYCEILLSRLELIRNSADTQISNTSLDALRRLLDF